MHTTRMLGQQRAAGIHRRNAFKATSGGHPNFRRVAQPSSTARDAGSESRAMRHIPLPSPARAHTLTPRPQRTDRVRPNAAAAPPAPALSVDPAPLGATLHATGQSTFKLWSPHAAAVSLTLRDSDESLDLERHGDYWGAVLPAGVLSQNTAYCVTIRTPDGRTLARRDPYARAADFDSEWCYADDPASHVWATEDWTPPDYDTYIIYEMHVGSFTPGGTFASAIEKLQHVKDLGFTAVQLMPIAEFSDLWGYSQRQPLLLHGPYGSPQDFREFVDYAHSIGLGVIIDTVLHHGAPEGNNLWDYDGWSVDFNGGIYHEGGPDTPWGRGWAFWKGEVQQMLEDSAIRWLEEYRCDGLRFDSANDLPHHIIQRITWAIKQRFPGRFLTAEVTPENPQAIHDLGFDSLWVHSGYFDIIQQHRALGRGHHGGGDWADGWNIPRLRSVLTLHYGFESPTQCIKYILGSHDQVGDQHGGAWYEDYKMIGGQHRYATDQFCGGRSDEKACAAARLWYTAGIGAAGIPMMFMGTEWAQSGWWHVDEHHRLQWDQAEDAIGQAFMTAVRSANALRFEYPVLRQGWANMIHEDRPNGVLACERVAEGQARMVVVVNAGLGYWQSKEYGLWVGGGVFEEVFSSQAVEFGGYDGWVSNPEGELPSYDGKLWISIPPQCTLIFRQIS